MGLGDGELIFNCFSRKLQPLLYLVLKRLKKQKKSPISGLVYLRNMFAASIIFFITGWWGSLSTLTLIFEGFFYANFSIKFLE